MERVPAYIIQAKKSKRKCTRSCIGKWNYSSETKDNYHKDIANATKNEYKTGTSSLIERY